MANHLYCCQNTIQNLHDHIIAVPDDFDVNPGCLPGINKADFINGLKELTEIIKSVYADMILNPGEYGLPLVEDIDYSPFNPKAAESKNSSFRLVALLHTLAGNSELTGSDLNVHEKSFSEALKKLKSVFKVANSKMIFNKLRGYGFMYENNIFSFPDNLNVIPALHGYMKNVPLHKPAVFSLNYNFVKHDLPPRPSVFAEYLSGNERDFFVSLSDFLEKENFALGSADDYTIYSYSTEYSINPKTGGYILRCYSDSGKLQIRAKFNNSGSYDYYIDNIPESVKQIFRRESTCRSCNDSCSMKLARSFEGKEYTDCGYNSFFNIDNYDMSDIEYYKQILLLERKAVKSNARKKGIKVYID
jgi:hypothetical protein